MIYTEHSSSILDLAVAYGYNTAKDFALFLKKYNPEIEITSSGKKIIQLKLL